MNHIIFHTKHFIAMNKSLISIFTLAIIAIYGVSCTAQDDDGKGTTIKSEKYEPCCDMPSDVNKTIEGGINVFVPNVFTPNGDGINDLFYPVVDTSLVPNGSVFAFNIFNSSDDKVKRSIWSRDFVNYNDLKNYAFNGEGLDPEKNIWIKWEGKFWYTFAIVIEGKGQFIFSGSACSVICDEESAIFKDKQGCFFPAQVTTKYTGDNKLSNQEKDCFK
jgi:hypothetical protein